jgi:hypothetical protein
LHTRVSVLLVGHTAPPLAPCVTTVRVRVCVPPPQSTVQPLHTPQSDITQLIGQSWMLQGVDSARGGQMLLPVPPLTIVRLRD